MSHDNGAEQRDRPRAGRRAVWHGVRTVWLLACLPVVFALVAAVLMIDRDITAPSWIKARVSDRAAQMLAGGRLDFGTITLNIGRDLHPRIRLTDTVLSDASGRELARIRQIGGLVSPRGLIFDRAALVQEVALSGAEISLRRDRDGAVAVQFGDGSAAQSVDGLSGVLDQVDQVFARPALAALERITLDGLVIRYDDARAGRTWTADGGTLALDLRNDETALNAAMALLTGGSVATLDLAYRSPDDSRAATITLNIDGLPATDLASQSPALTWLGALDAPLSGNLRGEVSEAADLREIAANLSVGKGQLRPPGGEAAVAFDSVEAALRYDPAAETLVFDRIAVDSEWGAFAGHIRATAQDMEQGLPGTLVAQVALDQFALRPGDLYPAPIALTDVIADLRVRRDPFRVDLGQAVLRQDGATLVAAGHAAAATGGWDLALDLTGDGLARDQMMTLWPEAARPGMRAWFDDNLLAGRVDALRIGWRQAPERAGQLAASFDFADTRLRFMPSMPPIEEARGSATLLPGRFALSLSEGAVTAPTGGRLRFAPSTMVLPELGVSGGPMELDMTFDSSITAALSMLDQPPFRFLSKANQSVTLAEGRARTTLSLRFPLVNPVPGDQVEYVASARLRDVASDTLIKGRTLRGRDVRVAVDNDGLRIAGPVTVDGVAARGAWSLTRGRPGSRVEADVTLSPAALETFNIALPPDLVSGSGEGQLTLDLRADRAPAFTLTSDLRGIRLSIPAVGWAKPPALSGTLELAGLLGATPRVDRLQLAAAGLETTGQVTLRPEGGLREARFDRVQLGGWLDAPVTLRGRGEGRAPELVLSGGTLDLRRAKLGAGGRDSSAQGGPLDITLRRLRVAEGVSLTNFKGAFSNTGGLSGNFTATVNDGPGLRGTLAPHRGRTAVRLLADDAGAVIAAAGFLKNGVGGSLDLSLIPAGGPGSFDGILALRKLRVRDAPAMAALLDAISVVGLLQQLDGQGLAFEEVDARFRLTPAQVIITEASAIGPGLGISVDGAYALASKTLDLQGVVSPFYLLNGIGSVLTRRGEGLIGFNFTITGPTSKPEVSVNPLSALTPGMFREIFRRPPPEVSP